MVTSIKDQRTLSQLYALLYKHFDDNKEKIYFDKREKEISMRLSTLESISSRNEVEQNNLDRLRAQLDRVLSKDISMLPPLYTGRGSEIYLKPLEVNADMDDDFYYVTIDPRSKFLLDVSRFCNVEINVLRRTIVAMFHTLSSKDQIKAHILLDMDNVSKGIKIKRSDYDGK